MASFKEMVKAVCPPVLYRGVRGVYHRAGFDGIDASHRFSGKVFCVGFHKTGTTSLEQVLGEFGYRLGEQAVGEILLLGQHRYDYDRLIRYCETAGAFQDTPFCLPDVFGVLDDAFPDAKFILTVRDCAEQWFQSLVRFHTRKFSSDKTRPPTEADLSNALYRYRGYMLDSAKRNYQYPDVALYDEAYYTNRYTEHNQRVMEHFRDRPGKLLVLNVSQPGACQALADFLNVTVSEKKQFPWKNRS